MSLHFAPLPDDSVRLRVNAANVGDMCGSAVLIDERAIDRNGRCGAVLPGLRGTSLHPTHVAFGPVAIEQGTGAPAPAKGRPASGAALCVDSICYRSAYAFSPITAVCPAAAAAVHRYHHRDDGVCATRRLMGRPMASAHLAAVGTTRTVNRDDASGRLLLLPKPEHLASATTRPIIAQCSPFQENFLPTPSIRPTSQPFSGRCFPHGARQPVHFAYIGILHPSGPKGEHDQDRTESAPFGVIGHRRDRPGTHSSVRGVRPSQNPRDRIPERRRR